MSASALKSSRAATALAGFFAVVLGACTAPAGPEATASKAPWVKTTVLETNGHAALGISGTIRARYETPVAFQVGGRIVARDVDAGETVTREQTLFRLDPRDLNAELKAAEAEAAAAEAQLASANADVARDRKLLTQGFVSDQAVERTMLAQREARTRVDAADARVAQARNALGYTTLSAEFSGVLMEVSGEPGQVVAAGQPVATLARDGEREVEVFLPDATAAPATAQAELPGGQIIGLHLREAAGALETASRTRRARYRIDSPAAPFPLGLVVKVFVDAPALSNGTYEVPIGAIDERGEGAQLWQLADNQVQPVPIQVVMLNAETALVRTDLPTGTHVVALGTHLLQPGMAVQELAP